MIERPLMHIPPAQIDRTASVKAAELIISVVEITPITK